MEQRLKGVTEDHEDLYSRERKETANNTEDSDERPDMKRRPQILEKSIFGVAPVDDFTRDVAEWIFNWTDGGSLKDVEVRITYMLYLFLLFSLQ